MTQKKAPGEAARKKRLLFVNDALQLGGVERTLFALLKRIDYRRYQVDVLVFGKVDETLIPELDARARFMYAQRGQSGRDTLYQKGCRFFIQRLSGSKSAFVRRLSDRLVIASYRALYRSCKRLVRRERYDAAIAIKQGGASLFVSEGFVHAAKKIMFYRHGVIDNKGIYDVIYPHADVIATLSGGMLRDMAAAFPAQRDKLVLIPNMIDYQAIRQKAEGPAPARAPGRVLLCSCGRMGKEKGYDLAVAAAALLKRAGVHFLWYFVGDGYQRPEIEKMIGDSGLRDDIVITGMLANPFPYMKLCDIYVHPSYVESFGNVLAEAMVLCRPIVATRTNGADFLVRDGENGLLTDFDPEALAGGVQRYLAHPELAARVIQTLREKDYDDYNRSVLDKINQLYE